MGQVKLLMLLVVGLFLCSCEINEFGEYAPDRMFSEMCFLYTPPGSKEPQLYRMISVNNASYRVERVKTEEIRKLLDITDLPIVVAPTDLPE